VNRPIVDIGESSLATADETYDVDMIVLATGFRASEVLYPLDIVGRDGVSLVDVWDGKPSAYRGISVPGFPNFFILGGPGTGLAHAGSIIFTTECEMRYIGDAVRTLLEGHYRSIEPSFSAYEVYKEELQAEVETLMWGHPSIEHSWYKSRRWSSMTMSSVNPTWQEGCCARSGLGASSVPRRETREGRV
jgi:4-hydroxyacetophenone monooxygenase